MQITHFRHSEAANPKLQGSASGRTLLRLTGLSFCVYLVIISSTLTAQQTIDW
jgi:hypothetical protein